MEYKERYKEVFAQIHPMRGFDPEHMYVRTGNRNMMKKLVCVAAVVAVLTSVCFTAYAVNLFGLRDLLLPRQHEVQYPVDEENVDREQQAYIGDMISLAGYNETPEARATAEWQAFLNSYDQDGAILGQIGNALTGFEEVYGFYQVYTQEMADKLEEIIAKYNLKLHTVMLDDLYTDEALCDQVGGDFLGENRAYSAYMYEDGTLKFDGEIDLEEYGHLDYQFQRCVRGSFTDILLNIVDVRDYAEWNYVTKSGIPVTLALAPHKALIIADLPDSFVTVNVLAGTETSTDDIFSHGPFDAEDLERFADSFDFSVLTPARPADPDLPRPTLEEALGKSTEEEFFERAGIQEPEAQKFFAEFSARVERKERQAVAEMLHYPADVTWWNASEAGTHLVYVTVNNAEEFLPHYDDVFTDRLWWNFILANQYDKERADLTSDDGMVIAAGGAIRFAETEEGIKVVTIETFEEHSFRPAEQHVSVS